MMIDPAYLTWSGSIRQKYDVGYREIGVGHAILRLVLLLQIIKVHSVAVPDDPNPGQYPAKVRAEYGAVNPFRLSAAYPSLDPPQQRGKSQGDSRHDTY